LIYLDSSALVKLILVEPESSSLRQWLAGNSELPMVSSTLHRAEVARAVWRYEPGDGTHDQAKPDGLRRLRQATARRGRGSRVANGLPRLTGPGPARPAIPANRTRLEESFRKNGN
jgi:hypothetical protein